MMCVCCAAADRSAIAYVQGSGPPTSKGKKGKKGSDAGVQAGASSVASGVKLENVSLHSGVLPARQPANLLSST